MSRTGFASFSLAKGCVARLGHVRAALHPIRDRGPGRLRDRLDEAAHAALLTDRDGEADAKLRADCHDLVGIEATVGPHRDLAARSGISDPADRLGQEVGGAPDGVGPTLAADAP